MAKRKKRKSADAAEGVCLSEGTVCLLLIGILVLPTWLAMAFRWDLSWMNWSTFFFPMCLLLLFLGCVNFALSIMAWLFPPRNEPPPPPSGKARRRRRAT